MMASVGSKIRLALVQLAVTKDKHINVQHACHKIREAREKGAQLVCLPECFNSPYGTQFFPEYSEAIPGETSSALSVAAKSNGVVVVGGSFPERDGGKLYNTTLVFGTSGQLLAKHRKVHLFDISIPGKITFRESDALSPGNSLTTVDLSFCKIGLGICYDIRFAEMAQVYAQKGCHLLLYPGAFNMTTGPAHWELLQRSRALDNQLFVATISPARDTTSSYVAWGHSMVVDPWGTVIAEADHTEQIVYADLDLEYLNNVRQQIPISKQRRDDLYSVVSHEAKQEKLEN